MSSSANSGGSKTERDKQKMIQDKCQLILTQMLRDEDNKYCVDCDAKGPRWASWNLGIFLCIRCAGIHRNLGVHISKVKSVNLDSWTPEQVVSLQQMGNSRARAVYEANLPDNFKRPQTDSPLETFIRAKYEAKKYIAKEWVQPPPVKVSWDAEIEMELKRKKEAKRKGSGSPGSVEIPTPTSSPAASASRTNISSTTTKTITKESPTPVVPIPAPVAAAAAKPSQDLLGLDVVNAPSSDDIFGGLLGATQSASSTPSASNGSTSAPASGKDSEEDSFFNQKAPSASEKRTLDKNSILALYNQGSSAQPVIQQQQQMATPAQQQLNVSMFATPHSGVSIYATPQTHPHSGHPGVPSAMGAFGQSPALQQLGPNVAGGAQFNPMLQGNHLFSSPMFPSAASASGLNQQHTPLNPAHNINQLSQQMMSGLQLGGPSPAATASPMIQPVNPMMHSGLNGGLTSMNNAQMGGFGTMSGQPMNHHPMSSTTMPSYPNVFLGSNMPTAAASSATGHSLSTNLWQ